MSFLNCKWHSGCVVISCAKAGFKEGEDVARARQAQSDQRGNPQRGGLPQDLPWQQSLAKHMVGAWAEVAVRDLVAPGTPLTVGTYRRIPDVAGLEVRGRTKDKYGLLLKKDDDPLQTFVLVQILGWWDERGPYEAHLRGCAHGPYIRAHGCFGDFGRGADPCFVLDPPFMQNWGTQLRDCYRG
jgi:hypothetical protein